MAKTAFARAMGEIEDDFHRRLGLKLELTKEPGGYYLKAAQTMVGANIMPKIYEEEFRVLLDNCPAQPF